MGILRFIASSGVGELLPEFKEEVDKISYEEFIK